ncbi:MAG: MetQ/NlpA family ABC transporter substrate-binding protein [Ruthenibacterium lactatiformans]
MKKFLALVLALVLALSLAACSGGAGYQIGIPADATNGGRALLLLQDLGILTLKEGVGLEATEQDIVENPHNVTIKAMEAANLPASLPDLDFAVINGNYASGAGIGDKVLTTEDAESVAAQTYGNVVAVKEGRKRPRRAGSGGRADERGRAGMDRGELQRRCDAHGRTGAGYSRDRGACDAEGGRVAQPSRGNPGACEAPPGRAQCGAGHCGI